MKLLIVSYEIPPTVGGAGIVAWQNAHALSEIGHEVTLVTVASGRGKIEDDNLPFKLIQVKGLSKIWILPFAWKIWDLGVNRFDAVIVNDIGAALAFSLFFTRSESEVKLLYYLHGDEVERIYRSPNMFFRLVAFPALYSRFLKRCDRLIAVSEYMKSYFIQNSRQDIPKDKIEVVYAGVDTNLFHYTPVKLREKLSILSEDTLLLSVSSIKKQKGYGAMADIFESIHKRDDRFHWIIVGDGDFLDELRARIRCKKLENKVTFIGALERKDLITFYSGVNLFWLLSEGESFGLVYAEAQLCGTPVMGPNQFGVRECIRHGETGYLINSNKEAEELIIKRDYLNMKKDDLIKYSIQFSLDNQAIKLDHILKDNKCARNDRQRGRSFG